MSEDNEEVYQNNEVYQDAFYFVASLGVEAAQRVWGTTMHDQVTAEETESAYVCKMDKPWLTWEEVLVEIWWGWVLWVASQGDEAIKVKLPRCDSDATASLSGDGVLTVVVPKQDRPQKWYKYKYKDLGLIRFTTIHVPIAG